MEQLKKWQNKIAFGFTLTGHNELELNASTNQERIEAIKKLHNAGFKTFASIEPIIDLKSSMDMIKQTIGYCDEYKIGLLSGDKTIKKDELQKFFDEVNLLATTHNFKVYWKDSINNKLK
jgi:DNA repair photolyase